MAALAGALARSPPGRDPTDAISVQLQSTSAQTPQKTRKGQTPESKTNQQHREPCEICKTSIPGSNPGGASNPEIQFNAGIAADGIFRNSAILFGFASLG